MNCCDYECEQGRNCPVRTRRVKPYPSTPSDDGFPIQMVEPKERPLRDAFLFAIVVAAVFALVAWFLTK